MEYGEMGCGNYGVNSSFSHRNIITDCALNDHITYNPIAVNKYD